MRTSGSVVACLILLVQLASAAPPKREVKEFDARGNFIPYTISESNWAVHVLTGAKEDRPEFASVYGESDAEGTGIIVDQSGAPLWTPGESLKKLIYAQLVLMNQVGLEIDLDTLRSYYDGTSVSDSNKFWGFFFDEEVDLRNKLEQFQAIMLERDCASVSGEVRNCRDRMNDLRDLWIFKDGKGRAKIPETDRPLLARAESIINFHAGIATYENIPDDCQDFFHNPVFHGGKNSFTRQDASNPLVQGFMDSQSPFIAGPSGTVGDGILFFEDTGPHGIFPHGLIPYTNPNARKALIGLWSAIVIAGGHHSLMEALLAAEGMGYFTDIELPSGLHITSSSTSRRSTGGSREYEAAVSAMKDQLAGIGLVETGIERGRSASRSDLPPESPRGQIMPPPPVALIKDSLTRLEEDVSSLMVEA